MDEKTSGWISIAAIILFIVCIFQYSALQSANVERDEALEQVSEMEYEISELQGKIDDANNYIADANDQLSTASGYAWEDYDTMGEVLENLSEVDTVSY